LWRARRCWVWRTVDGVALVEQRDVADHGPAVLGEDVQFFAERPERHLEVLQDRVGLVLGIEGVLLGAADGVLGLVEDAAEAGGLVGVDQVLDRAGVQHGLHELLGLVEVEELAFLHGGAHLQDAPFLVPEGVGAGAGRDIKDGFAPREGLGGDVLGQGCDLGEGGGVAGLLFARRGGLIGLRVLRHCLIPRSMILPASTRELFQRS
jgi:hypothetical protein